MKKIILSLYVCAFVVFPSLVEAGPVLRSGENVSIDSTQVLKGDFYGLAKTMTISGASEDDAYIAGGTITVNAPVEKDLTIAAGVVQIHGDVGDDLRVIGGDVTVGNIVKGDVVVLGGSLVILSTAVIEGDVLFMGGELTIEGKVNGSIHGTSDTVRINSMVGGDILFTANKSFTLGDKANIIGSLTYESAQELVRAQNAQVSGSIHRTDHVGPVPRAVWQVYLLPICMMLFIALVLFLLGRRHIQSIAEREKNTLGMSGLIGLGTFFIVPFVSGVLIVSVVGIPLGVALFALYILGFIMSVGGVGIMFGLIIQKLLTKKASVTLGTVFFGVIGLCAVSLVPIIGGIVLFAGIIIVLGMLSTCLYRLLRS